MDESEKYENQGYRRAEVEILVRLERMDTQLKTIDSNHVRRDEFEPIQRLVYGLVSIVLVAVIGAIVALVVIP